MVDADSKLYTHAHVAGLKRLSARASGRSRPGPHLRVIFSFSDLGRRIIVHLRALNVQIGPPLSEEDIQRVEAIFRFSFPPDLRGILGEGLPLGAGFPDWRDTKSQKLRMWMNLPMVGICQEVERGCFWRKAWGDRPNDLHQAAILARAALRRAPMLVPVFGHCYIPASPNRAGNPLFFIHEAEATYCGSDLSNFFQQELFLTKNNKLPFQLPSVVRGSFSRSDRYHEHCIDPVSPMDGLRSMGRNLSSWGWKYGKESGAWRRVNLECFSRQVDGLDPSSDISSLYEQQQRASKSSEGSFASSGDGTSWESSDDISAHKIHSTGAPSTFSPKESGKLFRRIEFWTEFVENSRLYGTAATIPLPQNVAEANSEKEEADEEEDKAEFASYIVFNQLEKILDQVATHLRGGGWKEDDILEILDASSPRSTCKIIEATDKQSILEGLAMQLDHLSTFMRKAGWSLEDVAETLSFDRKSADISIKHHAQASRPNRPSCCIYGQSLNSSFLASPLQCIKSNLNI